MGECESGAKIITPLRFQLPPRPNGAPQSATGGPPSKPILLSFPSAKKPREAPSADQKGNVALSVPATDSAASFPNERTHIRAEPLPSKATNASLVPSGLSVTDPPSSPIRFRVVPSGGNTKDLLEGKTGGVMTANAVTRDTAAAAGINHSNHRPHPAGVASVFGGLSGVGG